MAKFKKNLQDKQKSAIKCTKTSIVKKRRKKKDNKIWWSDIHKSNLKKLNVSNEIIKNTYTNAQSSKKKEQCKNKLAKDTERSNIPKGKKDNTNSKVFLKQMNINSKTRQKMKNKNKFSAKNTEESNGPTKYLRNNKKMSKIFQKIQINNETECKKKNKKRKGDMNLNYINKDAAINYATERNKKLQMSAKNLELEHRKMNIETVKNKKKKQISTEVQQIEPDEILKLNNHKINIKRLEEMLVSKSQLKSKVPQLTLRDRMMTQLRASRFRFINEILYNNDSSQSKHYFKTDPDAFMAYHAGYKQQLEQWAVNPLDIIISSIKKLPVDNVICDFGCGEARLAASVPHTVHSFDFIALNDRVKACDMAHTPLLMNSVHVVVFCLSLMGSNLNDYIIEANRILKNNGILKIAEVESRFEDVKDFIKLLHSYGFKNTWKNLSHNLFYFMDFKKEEDISMKKKNLPLITLKSCLYKKR